jgi:hypothetical protein
VSKNNSRASIDETTKFLFDAPCPAIIDLITRLFPIDLTCDSEIVRLSSECISHPGFSRNLPDIVFRVRASNGANSFIHIEVQTEHDGMMDLRMVKYGYLISASRSRFDHDECRVIAIHHQVVMYLEKHIGVTQGNLQKTLMRRSLMGVFIIFLHICHRKKLLN